MLPPFYDRFYIVGTETQHIEFMQIRLYLDIRDIHIPVESISTQHVDTLADYIS